MVAITKTAGIFAVEPTRNTINVMELARKWAKRYALRQKLARMDSHLLRDIGWSIYDARMEAAKPFWKA